MSGSEVRRAADTAGVRCGRALVGVRVASNGLIWDADRQGSGPSGTVPHTAHAMRTAGCCSLCISNPLVGKL